MNARIRSRIMLAPAMIPEGRSGMIRFRTGGLLLCLPIVACGHGDQSRGLSTKHPIYAGVGGDGEPPPVVLHYIPDDDEWEAPV